MQMPYELIQVTTADQLQLAGLYQPGDTGKCATILIHGFTADFYSHAFYHAIAAQLKAQNQALILAQTRGTGLHTEFIKSEGTGIYLGSFYEKIEDAQLDISAFVEFLVSQGYERIILAGHSLGTIKVVRYLFEGAHKDKIAKLILLAPFDKNVFMAMKAGDQWDKFLQIAKEKIDSDHGQAVVPVPEYEDFPMSYESFYSWYQHSELNEMWDFYRPEYKGEILRKISVPVQVILGEADEFTTYPTYHESPESVLEFLSRTIPHCEAHLIRGASHTYRGHEDEVAQLAAAFAR